MISDPRYTGSQLTAALAATEPLAYEAAGDPGVDDVYHVFTSELAISPAAHYTRGDFAAMLNAVADAINEAHDYESSETIWADDVANLVVNVAAYLLDHPGGSLDEAIVTAYGDIRPDFGNLPDGTPAPAHGTPGVQRGHHRHRAGMDLMMTGRPVNQTAIDLEERS